LSQLHAGDFRITHIRAGSYWWDGGAMFGVVPKTLWSKTQPCDELNRIEAAFNCFVVENGSTRILVETGGGVRHDERARERMRMPDPPVLHELLASQGFDPETFDYVINTHLHWDHAGGNTIGDLDNGNWRKVRPAFPNAVYIMQEGELEHARKRMPRDAVSYRPLNYEPLIDQGRVRMIDGPDEIFPGLRVRVASGHNRDMTIVLVESNGETWCHLADLVMYTAQTTPTWVSAFDLYPLQTIENKMLVLTMAAHEGWWCSFAHDPATAFARIESKEGKWEAKQCLP
jgi:glyoxylase-like metal-dependent hydrolase (beta-lactamase superfamily II)